jgi:bifunctional non-homologous end joining protein LigD
LVSGVPARGDWLYEIKFDGYRILTRFENGKPRLITRRGNDWSSKMPRLLTELGTMGVRSGWLDGEIVVLDEDGVPDFNALQSAFDEDNSADITYFLFEGNCSKRSSKRRAPTTFASVKRSMPIPHRFSDRRAV